MAILHAKRCDARHSFIFSMLIVYLRNEAARARSVYMRGYLVLKMEVNAVNDGREATRRATRLVEGSLGRGNASSDWR